MISREKRLEAAQLRVLFQVPFFAVGVMRLPVTFDSSVPTACTDGLGIRWNPQWFDKLKDPELVTVLAHEVCHCMLGHLWRAPSGCDWDGWNQATDHAVNLMLSEFGTLVTNRGLANPFPFPPPTESYCANPAFKGMSEEQIYGILSSQSRQGGGSKSGSGQSSGRGKQSGPGSKGNANGGNGSPGKHSMPAFGQMQQPDPTVPQSSQKKLANDWDGALIQACQMARGRGELPGGMERFVNELVNPQVPWTEVLRSWLREQCSDDWNFLEPDMCMESSGFILPSLKSEKMGPVVFATDTSGSIDKHMLTQFQTEKQNCLDDMKPSKVVDIYCDSKIQVVREFGPGESITNDCPGGGGTSFAPVWDYIAKMPIQPKCVVYLTDLDGNFGNDPGVPVIWVTWEKVGKAPFGQVIYTGT